MVQHTSVKIQYIILLIVFIIILAISACYKKVRNESGAYPAYAQRYNRIDKKYSTYATDIQRYNSTNNIIKNPYNYINELYQQEWYVLLPDGDYWYVTSKINSIQLTNSIFMWSIIPEIDTVLYLTYNGEQHAEPRRYLSRQLRRLLDNNITSAVKMTIHSNGVDKRIVSLFTEFKNNAVIKY